MSGANLVRVRWAGDTPPPGGASSHLVHLGGENVVFNRDGLDWTALVDRNIPDIDKSIAPEGKTHREKTGAPYWVFLSDRGGHSRSELEVLFTNSTDEQLETRINTSQSPDFVQTVMEIADSFQRSNIVATCASKLDSLDRIMESAAKRTRKAKDSAKPSKPAKPEEASQAVDGDDF